MTLKLIMKIHMYDMSIVRCCFDIIEIVIIVILSYRFLFFRTALKCIYRYNEIEIGGWSTPFVFHAFLCREKRQKIEDIKKNIRDAILVRIIPFSIFVYAIQFHISRGIQHSFKIMSNCLFLFHCVDLIIIILRDMHKA